MHLVKRLICAATLAMIGGAAQASDTTICAKDMVCASAPKTIVDALARAGYKPELGKDKNGDPKIDIEIAGYSTTVYFYGCTQNNLCDALQFYVSFDDPISNGLDYVNQWNIQKRWSQMAYEEGKYIRLSYDVTTLGGLAQENFADVVSWWESVLGDVPEFFEKHARKRK